MRTTKYLNRQQLDDVLEYLSKQRQDSEAVLIELSIRTGMRSEEIAKLGQHSIDERRCVVHVDAAKGSNDRDIPVKRTLVPYIMPAITDAVLAKRRSSDSLKRALRRKWKSVLFRSLGLGYQDLGLHAARASFAIAMYEETKDILLVQQLLGHKCLANTQFYVNINRLEGNKGRILKAIG